MMNQFIKTKLRDGAIITNSVLVRQFVRKGEDKILHGVLYLP